MASAPATTLRAQHRPPQFNPPPRFTSLMPAAPPPGCTARPEPTPTSPGGQSQRRPAMKLLERKSPRYTKLNDLDKVSDGQPVNVLVVVLGPRADARTSVKKRDFYIVDASSAPEGPNRRKTVLSVFPNQRSGLFPDFEPKRGTIAELKHIKVNKRYVEDPAKQILRRLPAGVLDSHGHLNAYPNIEPGWFVCVNGDATGWAEYHELKEWRDQVLAREWEEEENEEMEMVAVMERVEAELAAKEKEKREEERREEERRAEEEEIAELLELERKFLEQHRQLQEEQRREAERTRDAREKQMDELERQGNVWKKNGNRYVWFDGSYR